jgi:hypothetical protein
VPKVGTGKTPEWLGDPKGILVLIGSMATWEKYQLRIVATLHIVDLGAVSIPNIRAVRFTLPPNSTA